MCKRVKKPSWGFTKQVNNEGLPLITPVKQKIEFDTTWVGVKPVINTDVLKFFTCKKNSKVLTFDTTVLITETVNNRVKTTNCSVKPVLNVTGTGIKTTIKPLQGLVKMTKNERKRLKMSLNSVYIKHGLI